jgi:mannose-6-phosphate isomerase-like protein (cupin superfamily)
MRRVVTGHRNGKSVILEDSEMKPQIISSLGDGTIMWWTKGIPNIPVEEEEKNQLKLDIPKPGEIRLTLSTLVPDEECLRKEKEKGIDPVETWRKYFGDDYGMHTTDTIDYDIILSGEIWMEVDDGVEVHLKAGDCIVQNGTRHAWRNRGTKACVMATVMVGAKRKK